MKETTRAAFTKLTPQFQHQRMSLSLRLVFLPTLTLSGEILTPNSSLSLSLSLSLSAKRIKRVYSFSTKLHQSATRSASSTPRYCPCIFPKITCPLSMYLNAQCDKHVPSYELNFELGVLTHFSKHTEASCATTSLNTAFRFSSSRNCCILGSIWVC